MPIRGIREFIKFEASGGILLFSVAIVALILDNSPLSATYVALFHEPMFLNVGAWDIPVVLELVINDGFMTIFFLLVGLEIKRELFEGELNSVQKATLPGIAAIGGMVIPALFYVLCNHGDSVAMRGWAIPTATDIAFALGILSLLGSRVPLSLKVFLTALAIFDDIGAILIIAIFYSPGLSFLWIGLAAVVMLVLVAMNRLGVKKLPPYLLLGVVLWFCVLKSGAHSTLAGILLAFTIPLYDRNNMNEYSPLRFLEHKLHPWVAFIILPMFAMANAGVSLKGITLGAIFAAGVPMGIAGGLFIGKQIGIFGCTWLAVKCGACKMPKGATWLGIYGISLVCGVGFTMSLFIGNLAFGDFGTSENTVFVRLGVILGSLVSGLMGYLLLRFCSQKSWAIEHNVD